MSGTDPRLQRIALELDLVADTGDDWPESARAELRALARQVEEFNPIRPVEMNLSPAQARVLVFLRQFIADYGCAPTRKEISEGLGYASDNAALDHLKRLAAKGVITLVEGQRRGIRINKRSLMGAKS